MHKVLALTLLMGVVVSATFRNSADEEAFRAWATKYNRNYENVEEYMKRFNTWMKNAEDIKKSNAANKGYTRAINQFADMDSAEFAFYYLGALKVEKEQADFTYQGEELASSMDWTTKGAVTPIKNQGQCGSCWSFSTTGSLEGLHYLTKGSLLSFSEQQLVDCSGSYGNMGCNGGWPRWALSYTASKGIELESEYPYTAQDGTCQYQSSEVKFTNSGHSIVSSDMNSLMSAINQQPTSVVVDASSWPSYEGGIYPSSDCGDSIDHAVLAVGYESGNYWKIKNSWGASWGEDGFIRLAMGNTCDVYYQPVLSN